ncbi:class I adenylate-forming enzyme family protein [Micromonospora yangpuensis]|uniref:Acyl-CoA synthetase (AMP-forming)/AMP-acid ligase II n=1 Tax=Micromonospora yangpuensis TaxID=683228 RepID=A0A1C6UMN3_9ACTN|nr:AMP-binding protein [Micromonospora yangpuensis]GGM28016.1 fatty-acyl-CoA synthase [Micromonospora yangpuensis]SCL55286.1 Acyl-CoA synthetase (AMP-forming)/AMP-acid ligase II [Micromonospora yangpuensis]
MSTANIAAMLAGNALRFGDDDALVFEDRRWTHRQLDVDVNALAAGLSAEGVRRDSRVAIVANNVPEFLLLSLALAKLGAVFVPLNYRLTAGELAQLIGHARVEAVATVPEYAELTDAALTRAGVAGVRRFALEPIGEPAGRRGAGDASWVDLRSLVAAHRGTRVPDAELDDGALQRIVYTSGTTSLPKGVLLTHGNVNMNMHAQVVELGLRPSDRILNVAPLYHVGGTDLPGYGIWHVGGCMVLQRRFEPAAVRRVIEAERITGMVLAATMLDMVRRATEVEADLSSVRWVIYSQVTSALFAVARELFPRARLIEGYGLTETCSGLTYLDAAHQESKQGSVGIPVPWVQVRVVDPDGRDVPVGQDGEVVARGPKVSPGYLDDPAATAAAFRDGWFHTGDVGRLDADGYLYIRDRLKDMIRSGGENISSAEIENVLADHPLVLAAAVVGAPDPVWQEVPVAFVVGRPGLTPEDLIGHARRRLGRFKVPKEVYLVPEFPTNPSGKVLKRSLRELRGTLRPDWRYAGSAGDAGSGG